MNECHYGKDNRVNGARLGCVVFVISCSACKQPCNDLGDTQVPIYWVLNKGTEHFMGADGP
jgi:hypothetical protein